MEVKILEKEDKKIKFIISGVNPSFIGALRRIMVSELPTMAIEWVDFKQNNSAMPDEVLANRMGQVPLTYDKKAYNLPSECKCEGEGCSRCQVKLSLKKKGPAIVYSNDFKSTDKSVQPAIEKIPLVEIFEDQEIQLTATAQLGTGRQHAKWKGAVVGYKNVPKIKMEDMKKEEMEKVVESCPKKILNIKKGKVQAVDEIECIMCKQCEDAVGAEKIKVEPVEDAFIVNVETVSGLGVEEVVMVSADILGSKMKAFKKALKKVK